MALGEETRELFDCELKDVVPTVNTLLCCDLACLVRLLGLGDVFHPSSHAKCCWCHATKDNIGNFSIEHWGLRNPNEFARDHYGTLAPPLFNFPWTKVIPCNLHALERLAKQQLVTMCMNRKLKKSGNKEELCLRIQNYEEAKFVHRCGSGSQQQRGAKRTLQSRA